MCIVLVYTREGDPKGWSTVLVTALGSWGTLATIVLIIQLKVNLMVQLPVIEHEPDERRQYVPVCAIP
jgi:hypothetical protein